MPEQRLAKTRATYVSENDLQPKSIPLHIRPAIARVAVTDWLAEQLAFIARAQSRYLTDARDK